MTPTADNDVDISQADLSGLSLKEMTTRQRAELKRRFEVFRQAYTGVPAVAPERPKVPRKWVPPKKA